jgi:hypothetical protein
LSDSHQRALKSETLPLYQTRTGKFTSKAGSTSTFLSAGKARASF